MSGMADADAIEAIKRVKYRYLRALDTKHWDDFADTLTEDIVGDYGSSLGKEHHFTNRTELVEYMRTSMPAGVITEHRVTHPEITVDGESCRSHLVPAGPRDRAGVQLHAVRGGVLPRPVPQDCQTAGRSARPDTTAPMTCRNPWRG